MFSVFRPPDENTQEDNAKPRIVNVVQYLENSEGRKEATGRLNPDTCAWDWKGDRRPGVYVGNCEKPLSVTALPEYRGLTLCDWTPGCQENPLPN